MQIRAIKEENADIALVSGEEIIINSAQDALDLIVMVHYDYGCNKIIINKRNITEDFFELRNKLAGDIMQKFVNYEMAIAIVGDFESYTSSSLKSLIYESNKGNKILFSKTETEAIEVFSRR